MNTVERMTRILRANYDKFTTISPDGYASVKALCGRFPDDVLLHLAGANIRFVSTACISVLVDRGALPPSARIDNIMDHITASAAKCS